MSGGQEMRCSTDDAERKVDTRKTAEKSTVTVYNLFLFK